jgi:hypothetical protein
MPRAALMVGPAETVPLPVLPPPLIALAIAAAAAF